MKKIIASFIFISLTMMAYAQMTVSLSPTPNPDLSTWENRPEIIRVTINNPGNAFEAKFSTKITLDGQVKASTKKGSMQTISIERGLNQFFAEDVMPYQAVSLQNVSVANITRTGQLPAGTYQLCVSLTSPNDRPLSLYGEQCGPFMISQIQAPNLISPIENMVLSNNERPTFRWTPVSPQPSETVVHYIVKVYEILPGQGMIQAMRSNQPLIQEKIQGVTQFWPTEWDLPEKNTSYVWIVSAVDDNGVPIGSNKGLSEPKKFSVIDQGGGGDKIADGQEWTMCAGFVCKSKGVKLEIHVPWDAGTTGSTTYKISAWSVNISYYATADQVLAEFGTTGAPEVDDWIGYVSSGSSNTYCDKNGFPIVNQVVYEVSKPNPTNYNGNTNELHASGACFDYTDYTSLAVHYNGYNNTYADVPTSCSEGCLDGGTNPNDPIGGGNVNAANEEIDDITLEPLDGDGGLVGGGGIIDFEEATFEEHLNENIVWVVKPDGTFQGYKSKESLGKSIKFCLCAEGVYCLGDANCNCCPKKDIKKTFKAKNVKTCKCKIGKTTYKLLGSDNCGDVCDAFRSWHYNQSKR